MRRLGLAVILALVLASAGSARTVADVRSTLACSGTTCTLAVTNTSGHAFLQLSMILQGFPPIAKMTDPKASSQNVGTGGSTIVTIPAGQCWVGTGAQAGQASCAAFTADHSAAWSDGETHTITITAASAVAKGAKISLCPQAASGGASCSDVSFGATGGGTTTASRAAPYPDWAVSITPVYKSLSVKHSSASFTLEYDVLVRNIGTAHTGRVQLLLMPREKVFGGPNTSSRLGRISAPSCNGGTVLICPFDDLRPGQAVHIHATQKIATARWLAKAQGVVVQARPSVARPADDPHENDEDETVVLVTIR